MVVPELYPVLLAHLNHPVQLVAYGDNENLAVECLQCGELIVDASRGEDPEEGGG